MTDLLPDTNDPFNVDMVDTLMQPPSVEPEWQPDTLGVDGAAGNPIGPDPGTLADADDPADEAFDVPE